MPRLERCVIALLIAAGAHAIAADSSRPLRVAELKRICSTLLDRQAFSPEWTQLAPYFRDRHALDAPEVLCSFSCNGSIELRDGYTLDYIYINPQTIGKPWKPNDAIVYSVTLRHGTKKVFRREVKPKA